MHQSVYEVPVYQHVQSTELKCSELVESETSFYEQRNATRQCIHDICFIKRDRDIVSQYNEYI